MPLGTSNFVLVNPGVVQQMPDLEFCVLLESTTDGLIAHAGGGLALAKPITTRWARFSSVVSDGDSCKVPLAKQGMVLIIRNDGASSLNIFPSSLTESMNGAAGEALAVAAGKEVALRCYRDGAWIGAVSN